MSGLVDYPRAVKFSDRFTCGDNGALAKQLMPKARRNSAVWTVDSLLAQVAAACTVGAAVMVSTNDHAMREAVKVLGGTAVLSVTKGKWCPGISLMSTCVAGKNFPSVITAVRQGRPCTAAGAATPRLWKEMQKINNVCRSLLLQYPGPAWWAVKPFGRYPLVLEGTADKDLTRVFAPPDVAGKVYGGRMFGAFWINQKRTERSKLMLNSQPIVGVDVNAFNLRALYALQSEPWPWDDGDPYIAGPGPREAWKKLTNVMLAVSKPLESWPRSLQVTSEDTLLGHGWSLPGAKAAIIAKHPVLQGFWYGNNSMRLQRIESDMVVAALLQLYRENVPCFPVHDAIYTTADYAEAVRPLLRVDSYAVRNPPFGSGTAAALR